MRSIPTPLPDSQPGERPCITCSPDARALPSSAPTAAGTSGKARIMVWQEKPAHPFPLPQPGAQLRRVSSNKRWHKQHHGLCSARGKARLSAKPDPAQTLT